MIALAASLVGSTVPAFECRVMRVARAAGEIVVEADSAATACLSEIVPPKLRFDARRGVAVARTDLREGERLGRVYLPARPAVLPGDSITLEARIGHVTIQRTVTALQPAMSRQRFFVRDAQGKVLQAPLLAGETSR